ncbi:MAG: chemotaxis protein CheA [Candidatus Marinimicrobia bacterium]|nr:chemotaxis protein CheA [Candidatus Neomarinimicrobiota bacterium]
MSVYDNLVGMEEILDEFIVETTELLEAVNEDLIHLESNPDEEILNRIFRAFHTFKGTCGFLGFTQAKDLAHVAEDLLNQLRNGKLKPNGFIIDSLLESSDWFGIFINDVKEREERVYEIEPLIKKLEAALAGEGSGDAKEQPTVESEAQGAAENGQPIPISDGEAAKAAETVLSDGEVSESRDTDGVAHPHAEILEIIDTVEKDLIASSNQIKETNVGELASNFGVLEENCAELGVHSIGIIIEKTHRYLSEVAKDQITPTPEGNVAVVEVLQWFKGIIQEAGDGLVEDDENVHLMDSLEHLLTGQIAGKEGKSGTKDGKSDAGTQTIRVDMGRLENLMNLAGELVLNRNQLVQAYSDLAASKSADTTLDDLDQVNNSLGRITTEIQEAVMQMRMLPISNVFRKFPRVIRDLTRKQGKQVELVTVGEETELDRSVIEAISDPLLHLVRNAADHGIESPDIRQAKGKPATGTVTLRAAHEGNHIVIEVEDDGAGIDADKLVTVALKKGVISPEEAEAMSYREKLNLIFRPGFSTAKNVTDVSGRGVGMDVVQTNVSKLNGAIDIDTKLGEGTRITIKLPLTLAIVTGLKVAVWDEEYIIPFSSIIETVKMSESELTKIEDKWVIRFRESVINTLYLDEWFKVEHDQEKKDQEFYAVVVSVAAFRYALVVTGLKGQEEAVIKPLGQMLGRIPGIAGGTIGGDGRITLILDVPELIHHMGLG